MKNLAKSAAAAWSLLALAAGAGPAHAVQDPFGPNIGGWWFTQEAEANGLTNCRGHLKQGKLLYIMAMRTNGEAYVSVTAGRVKGTYPESWLQLANDALPVLAKTFGDRLVFAPLTGEQLYMIAEQGGYTWQITDKADTTGTVNLGAQAIDAADRIIECISANS
jgi:hypothetical protein